MSLKKKLLGCFGILCITLASLFFLFVISFVVWYQYAERGGAQVDNELQRLRAEDLPVDNETVGTWYESNTDPSDTEAWLGIQWQLKGDEFQSLTIGLEGFDRGAEGTGWKPEGWPEEIDAREVLAFTESLRREIRSLARKRVPVRFPIHFDSINTSLKEAESMRKVAHLVRLEFDAAAADRNSDELAESAQTMLDLALVCSKSPGLISHVICIAIRQMGFESLKQALESNLLDDKALEHFALSLPNERLELQHFAEIIQGERGLMLPMFMDLQAYTNGRAADSSYRRFTLRASNQDIWHFLELMARLEKLDTETLDDAIASSTKIARQFEKDMRGVGYLQIREWIITGITAPPVEATVYLCCDESVLHRQVLHAIAIRRYQHRNGTLPPDLSALKQVDFDAMQWWPPGGMPMGYQLDGEGPILWSTLKDDGGQTSDTPPIIKKDDYGSHRRERLLWNFLP